MTVSSFPGSDKAAPEIQLLSIYILQILFTPANGGKTKAQSINVVGNKKGRQGGLDSSEDTAGRSSLTVPG